MTEGTCKSCGARIGWVTMRESGRKMPVDLPGEIRVVCELDGNLHTMETTYTSHFATCPNAAEHRKRP